MTLGRLGTVVGGALIAVPLVAGCARQVLTRGDDQLVAGNYRAAITMYEQFLRSNPADPSAARVRATHDLLARYLRAEEDSARVTDLRAEVARLRGALEKLKAIDVQTEKKR